MSVDVGADSPPRKEKALTIGAVCKQLEREFPDISISKIRYLEDQKLLTPRRTPGGYRLYSPGDVARLRTILRLQRDEFLPLRVIRQELAAGRADDEVAKASPPDPRSQQADAGGPAQPGFALPARRRAGGDGRRPRPREGAGGLRRDQGRAPGRRDALRRHRARDRARR